MQLSPQNRIRISSALISLACFCISGYISSVNAKSADYSKQIDAARKYIDQDKGQQALEALKSTFAAPDYNTTILTAQAYATLNNPRASLHAYERALKMAKNEEERQVALFGIGKVRFWLSRYVSAADTYRELLKTNLNKGDHELALAGLARSLANYDRPRKGYKIIPQGMVYTTPEMVLAATQASLWAGWPDITQNILHTYQPIINKLPADSPLYRDIQDATWQANLADSPNVVTPTFFYSADNEHFVKQDSTLEYSHFWSRYLQSAVGAEQIFYQQNGLSSDLTGIYLKQTFQPTRNLILAGTVEPTEFRNWSPLLWRARADFIPNDTIRFEIDGMKEIIETFPAFFNRISDSGINGGLVLKPVPYVTLAASLNQQYMTDNNQRQGYFISGEALILPYFGLNALFNVSGYSNRFRSPFYFSPKEYRQYMFGLRFGRKIFATWHYYIDAGLGGQQITNERFSLPASNPTQQAGFGVNGPITDWLTFNAYYYITNKATAFTNSPSYTYQAGAISLNFLF